MNKVYPFPMVADSAPDFFVNGDDSSSSDEEGYEYEGYGHTNAQRRNTRCYNCKEPTTYISSLRHNGFYAY